MDDDLRRTGRVKVRRGLAGRVLVKLLRAVRVFPGQQQILDLHPLLAVLLPSGVVELSALAVLLTLS